LPISQDNRVLPLTLGDNLSEEISFVTDDSKLDRTIIPPYLFTYKYDVELHLGYVAFKQKSYEPVIRYLAFDLAFEPDVSAPIGAYIQYPTIRFKSKDVLFAGLDSGSTRHHINKATAKDLGLEQMNPDYQLWNEQFGCEENAYHIPLEIPDSSIGIIEQEVFTTPTLPYNFMSGQS
jgi:hypothetical protein